MPRPWLYVQLAERFGGWPEDYRRKPVGELLPWLSLLAIEGRVAAEWDGLGPDDDVARFDDDEDA